MSLDNAYSEAQIRFSSSSFIINPSMRLGPNSFWGGSGIESSHCLEKGSLILFLQPKAWLTYHFPRGI